MLYNSTKIIMMLLNMRHENLMLRIENCGFRNADSTHDRARLTEVEELQKIFKEWTNE